MKQDVKSKKNIDNRLSLALQRAQAAVLSRDYPLAIRLYNRLIISQGDNLDLLLNLASVYVRANKDDKALKIYTTIQERLPDTFEVLTNLGGIYRRLGRYQDSIDVLEKALKLGTDIEAVKYSMGFTYKLMGKYDAAAECFMSVTDINPNDVLAYNQLGTIEDIRGNYEKAQHAFSRGLQIDPNHPILHFNASMSYLSQKEYTLAKKHCEDALKAKPGWPDAMSLYADLLELTDAKDEAKKILKSAVKLNPENAQLHTNLGNYYESKKDFPNAETSYLKALKIAPNNTLTLYDLAHVYIQQKKYEDAIKIYEKLEELDGENDHLIMQHAKALMGLNQMVEAMAKIRGLENKTSDELSSLNMFSQYFIRNKEIDKAKEYLHKIQKNFPTASSYLLDNAEQYTFMGYFSESKSLLDKYLLINENDSQAWNLLGENYKAVKLYSRALDAWKKSYELSKDSYILDSIGDLIQYFEPDSKEMEIIAELLKSEANHPDFERSLTDIDEIIDTHADEEDEDSINDDYEVENNETGNTNIIEDEFDEDELSGPLFNLDASTLGEDPLDEYEPLIFDENEEIRDEKEESFLDLKSLVPNDIPEDFSDLKDKSHMFDNDDSKQYSQHDPIEDQEYMNVDGFGFEDEELEDIDEDDKNFGLITDTENTASNSSDTPNERAYEPPAMQQQPYPQQQPMMQQQPYAPPPPQYSQPQQPQMPSTPQYDTVPQPERPQQERPQPERPQPYVPQPKDEKQEKNESFNTPDEDTLSPNQSEPLNKDADEHPPINDTNFDGLPSIEDDDDFDSLPTIDDDDDFDSLPTIDDDDDFDSLPTIDDDDDFDSLPTIDDDDDFDSLPTIDDDDDLDSQGNNQNSQDGTSDSDNSSSSSANANAQDGDASNENSNIDSIEDLLDSLYLDDENLIDEIEDDEEMALPELEEEPLEELDDDLIELIPEESDDDVDVFPEDFNSIEEESDNEDFSNEGDIDAFLPDNLDDHEIFDNSDNDFIVDDEKIEFDDSEDESETEDTDFDYTNDDIEDLEIADETNLKDKKNSSEEEDNSVSDEIHESPIAEYLPENESDKFEDALEEVDLSEDIYDFLEDLDDGTTPIHVDDFKLLEDDEDETEQEFISPDSELTPFSHDYFLDEVTHNPSIHEEIAEDDRPREVVMMNQVRKVIKKSFNSPPIKKFHNTAGMFESLRTLYDNYLSQEKKDTLLSNLKKDDLEYVATRIQNGPGLLSAAAAFNNTSMQKK